MSVPEAGQGVLFVDAFLLAIVGLERVNVITGISIGRTMVMSLLKKMIDLLFDAHYDNSKENILRS